MGCDAKPHPTVSCYLQSLVEDELRKQTVVARRRRRCARLEGVANVVVVGILERTNNRIDITELSRKKLLILSVISKGFVQIECTCT